MILNYTCTSRYTFIIIHESDPETRGIPTTLFQISQFKEIIYTVNKYATYSLF